MDYEETKTTGSGVRIKIVVAIVLAVLVITLITGVVYAATGGSIIPLSQKDTLMVNLSNHFKTHDVTNISKTALGVVDGTQTKLPTNFTTGMDIAFSLNLDNEDESYFSFIYDLLKDIKFGVKAAVDLDNNKYALDMYAKILEETIKAGVFVLDGEGVYINLGDLYDKSIFLDSKYIKDEFGVDLSESLKMVKDSVAGVNSKKKDIENGLAITAAEQKVLMDEFQRWLNITIKDSWITKSGEALVLTINDRDITTVVASFIEDYMLSPKVDAIAKNKIAALEDFMTSMENPLSLSYVGYGDIDNESETEELSYYDEYRKSLSEALTELKSDSEFPDAPTVTIKVVPGKKRIAESVSITLQSGEECIKYEGTQTSFDITLNNMSGDILDKVSYTNTKKDYDSGTIEMSVEREYYDVYSSMFNEWGTEDDNVVGEITKDKTKIVIDYTRTTEDGIDTFAGKAKYIDIDGTEQTADYTLSFAADNKSNYYLNIGVTTVILDDYSDRTGECAFQLTLRSKEGAELPEKPKNYINFKDMTEEDFMSIQNNAISKESIGSLVNDLLVSSQASQEMTYSDDIFDIVPEGYDNETEQRYKDYDVTSPDAWYSFTSSYMWTIDSDFVSSPNSVLWLDIPDDILLADWGVAGNNQIPYKRIIFKSEDVLSSLDKYTTYLIENYNFAIAAGDENSILLACESNTNDTYIQVIEMQWGKDYSDWIAVEYRVTPGGLDRSGM